MAHEARPTAEAGGAPALSPEEEALDANMRTVYEKLSTEAAAALSTQEQQLQAMAQRFDELSASSRAEVASLRQQVMKLTRETADARCKEAETRQEAEALRHLTRIEHRELHVPPGSAAAASVAGGRGGRRDSVAAASAAAGAGDDELRELLAQTHQDLERTYEVSSSGGSCPRPPTTALSLPPPLPHMLYGAVPADGTVLARGGMGGGGGASADSSTGLCNPQELQWWQEHGPLLIGRSDALAARLETALTRAADCESSLALTSHQLADARAETRAVEIRCAEAESRCVRSTGGAAAPSIAVPIAAC